MELVSLQIMWAPAPIYIVSSLLIIGSGLYCIWKGSDK